MQRGEKRSEGSVGTKRERNGSSYKQGGKSREKCLVVGGVLLLMGQHELNATTAIVYSKHESGKKTGEGI